MSWIHHPNAYLIAAAVCLLLTVLIPNRWIRRRLLFSSVVFLLDAAFFPVTAFALELSDRVFEVAFQVVHFSAAVAVLNALVSTLFNPLRGQGVSDRWPSIVQDVLVLAGPTIFVLFTFSEQLLALGVAGSVVIGIALKDTLGNLFAGLALQSEKPFHVGDWVVLGDHEGQVQEATWRATKIRTKAGNFVIIPNSVIAEEAIINYSEPTTEQRLERVVRMGHGIRPNDFKKAAMEVFADMPEALESPAPDVLTHEYDEYSLQYRCRFWINDYARSEPILDNFCTLLYYRLLRSGMPLPLPTQNVRLGREGGFGRAVARATDKRLAFVESVDLFSGLKEESRELIARQMRLYTFGAGERILTQGAAGESMFFIERGKVRIVIREGTASKELAVLGRGQYMGEMALLTGEPRAASAIAVGDVESYVLDKPGFKKVLMSDKDVAGQISAVVATRKEVLDEKREELGSELLARQAAQKNLLSRIQNFFGL